MLKKVIESIVLSTQCLEGKVKQHEIIYLKIEELKQKETLATVLPA